LTRLGGREGWKIARPPISAGKGCLYQPDKGEKGKLREKNKREVLKEEEYTKSMSANQPSDQGGHVSYGKAEQTGTGHL